MLIDTQDYYMIAVAAAFIVLGIAEILYSFLSKTGERRITVFAQGMISIYVSIVYILFAIDVLEHGFMRYYMRGAIIVVFFLFAADLGILIAKRPRKQI